MIVVASNMPYFFYLKSFIRMLIDDGKVPQSQIRPILFGGRYECQLLKRELKAIFPKVKPLIANLEDAEFRFLEEDISNSHWALITDYLRAWAGKTLKKYIWIDLDVIVNKPLTELLALSKNSTRMSMASDFEYRISPAYPKLFKAYIKAYRLIHKDFPHAHFDEEQLPMIMNCGVIILDRDYSEEWQSSYRMVAASKAVRNELAALPNCLGQAIWNVLFWANNGEVLDSKYNYLIFRDYLAKLRKAGWEKRMPVIKSAVLHHYAGPIKEFYFGDLFNKKIKIL